MSSSSYVRKQTLRRVLYFFPLQLLFLHLKRNHFLLLVWLFFFGIVTQGVGEKFGLPDLFLYPEYLGDVNFWSYAILGFAVGGFTMAFHIHSYVAHSHKFPFIATLSRPFLKFTINNSFIPNLFALVHAICIYQYQSKVEMMGGALTFLHVGGYVFGGLFFFALAFLYFFRTNINLNKVLQKAKRKKGGQTRFGKKKKWFQTSHDSIWRIETYMSTPFKIRLARGSEHYEDEVLQKVFSQNHLNASVFELVVIASFVLIGSLRSYAFFMVPAGAAIFLLFTMILMIASAIHSWVKGWSLTLIIGIFLVFNFLSWNTELFRVETQAYGMKQDKEPVVYSSDSLKKWRDDRERVLDDRLQTLKMLENWKEERIADGDSLPKMVLLNVSGGGLRSALWTTRTIQHIDSLLEGSIFEHTPLITGSSGGMLGAAYLREQYLRQNKDSTIDLKDKIHRERVSQDLLNPIAFSIVTTDLFFPYRSHTYKGVSYKRDRAYAFEESLNANTNGILDKPIGAYEEPVKKAEIPMMIQSPSIVNDGRRLLISSLPLSYMMDNTPPNPMGTDPMVEDIGFHRMFEEHGSKNLRFLTSLRMNATFPYILPTTSLPSKPRMEVMDAGLRDNYGTRTSINFLYHFRSWIEANTSGVIVLQIRDKERQEEPDQAVRNSFFQNLTRPVGSLYENVFRIQDHEQSLHFQHANLWFEGDLDVVNFELTHFEQDRISLSFHLTSLEKRRILSAIWNEENQECCSRLKNLLEKAQP